jgi:Uncharacterized conserved protein
MRTLLVVLALSLSASSLAAATVTYEIRPEPKQVAEFHAEDTYDSFDGRTSRVSGTIVADAAAPSAAKVEVTVDLASLDTGVALRNKEMREIYLETGKFPVATFRSTAVAGPESIQPNQPAEIGVTGDFTLHGVTRTMRIPIRVVLIPDGRVHATAHFNIKLGEFGIRVPHNVLVTVDDQVPVTLDLWAVAK